MITYLDHSGDGVLSVDEIDVAMRKAKKRQRNIPRDAMSRIHRSPADTRKEKDEQLKLFLPKVIQRRHFGVKPDATTASLQWKTIHAAPEHMSPTKSM